MRSMRGAVTDSAPAPCRGPCRPTGSQSIRRCDTPQRLSAHPASLDWPTSTGDLPPSEVGIYWRKVQGRPGIDSFRFRPRHARRILPTVAQFDACENLMRVRVDALFDERA